MSEQGRRWLGRGGMVLAVAGVMAILAGYFVGVEGDGGVGLMLAGFAVAIVGVYLGEKFSNPKEAKRGARSGESRRDVEQRKWAYSVLLIPICSFSICMFSSNALREWVSGTQDSVTSTMLLGPLMAMTGFVFLVSGLRNKHAQKWLNDELMRAYLASAMAWGFVAAFVGLCVVFGVMLWRMSLVLPMMPFVLWTVVSVASVRLWWQVREGEGG